MSAPRPGAPIVLFLVDQLRAEALGAAGNRFVRTPHLDRLARESVRFESCVTNAPLCRPSRFTLMTGLPVAGHRISTNARVADPGEAPSHVRRLREQAGYHALVIGKTHLHDGRGHLDRHLDRLRAWGFSDAVELPDAQEHRLQSAYTDWLSSTTPAGQIDRLRLWRDYTAHHDLEAPPPDAEPWRLSTEDHLDSFCARIAADRVLGYAGDRPLYLQVNFPGPHPPFDPTSEFLAPLDPEDPALPLPILAPSRGPSSALRESYRRAQRREWTGSAARGLRVRYYGKVALVDRGVGRVLEALERSGLSREAWIVLTSDHGELLGDHRMTGKVLCYESSLRVPLLIRPPGGIAGWVDRGTVDLLDLVATLTALGGLDPAGMAGTSLIRRALEGPQGPLAHRHKAVVFENMGQVGLRTEGWKLAWDLRAGRPAELYDRRADPDELWNRVEDPEARLPLARMVDRLRGLRSLPG